MSCNLSWNVFEGLVTTGGIRRANPNTQFAVWFVFMIDSTNIFDKIINGY